MAMTILLSLFIWQPAPELSSAGNAAVVQVYGINTPQTVEIREGEDIEVPVIVMWLKGAPEDGYRSVTAMLRYDSARLEFIGVRTGNPGTLSKPIDSVRDASNAASTMRRVTVTWTNAQPGDTRELGELFLLTFRARELPDADMQLSTAIGWDSSQVRNAAGATIKAETRAPTTVIVKQNPLIDLMAPVRKAREY